MKHQIKCHGNTCPERYTCTRNVSKEDKNVETKRYSAKCEWYEKKGETK